MENKILILLFLVSIPVFYFYNNHQQNRINELQDRIKQIEKLNTLKFGNFHSKLHENQMVYKEKVEKFENEKSEHNKLFQQIRNTIEIVSDEVYDVISKMVQKESPEMDQLHVKIREIEGKLNKNP